MEATPRGHSSLCPRFFINTSTELQLCSFHKQFMAEGLNQTAFIIILQLSVSLFYLLACVDNISSINNATPLVW